MECRHQKIRLHLSVKGRSGISKNPFNQLSGQKDTVYEEIAFGLQNFGIERDEMVKG